RLTAATEHLAGEMEVRLAHGEPLGERERVAGLDQDVETPAFHLRAFVDQGHIENGGRCLAHGHSGSCCYRRTLLGVVRTTFCKDVRSRGRLWPTHSGAGVPADAPRGRRVPPRCRS